jgi:hypothetical protein
MRWTHHMDEILADLTKEPETEYDDVLVLMTGSYRIMEEVLALTAWRVEADQPHPPRAPLVMHAQALQTKLTDLIKHTRPWVLSQSTSGNHLVHNKH